jgi:hypothetical protein
MTLLRHLLALLSTFREPRRPRISQLHIGLVFGFWVTTAVEGNFGDEKQQRQNVPAKHSSDCNAPAATAFLLIDVPAQLPHTGGELLRSLVRRM